MIHPRDFMADFVTPALEHWREHQHERHLAIHAITQLDVLAEVVAIWRRGKPGEALPSSEVRDFRQNLARKAVVFSIIRHVHDSHKHGILSRKGREHVTKGQRPETVEKLGFFANVTASGGPLTPYTKLAVVLDDGTEQDIYSLLDEAVKAWDEELNLLGI